MSRLTRQNGAVLVVALILLILVTLLGLSGIRTITLEEKMTSAALDRSIAFNAAETALRAGEDDAMTRPLGLPPAATDGACDPAALIAKASTGYISRTDVDCGPDWPGQVSSALWDTHAKKATTDNLGSAAGASPSYIIEYLGNDFSCEPTDPQSDKTYCSRYRVTARAVPAAGRADVMLQSIYFSP